MINATIANNIAQDKVMELAEEAFKQADIYIRNHIEPKIIQEASKGKNFYIDCFPFFSNNEMFHKAIIILLRKAGYKVTTKKNDLFQKEIRW